jgi:sulfite reductase (NADPH) hemoprotein beta-component
VPGHAIVTASLKPAGSPPGDATAAQMEGVADSPTPTARRDRVSHEQNLIFPHVALDDLPKVYKALAHSASPKPMSA